VELYDALHVAPIRLNSMNAVREELLTVEEVADYLKVNKQTVCNWIDRDALRATRIGQRRVRIRQSELKRFIAAGEPQAGTPGDSRAIGARPVSGWRTHNEPANGMIGPS
jgi:excisionase family DNA binding protein